MPEDKDPSTTKNEAKLQKIRKRYTYLKGEWEPHRKERAIDMRFLLNDPWDPADKKAREEAGRPCISHDELTQYVNSAVNNLRMNKRAIKVSPKGEGANDQTAELHQDLIRTEEYESQAQAAYITAAEAAISGSYGFFKIRREYISDDSFAQRIDTAAIINPDSILYDLDCKKPDWSDPKDVFVLESMSEDEFASRWPRAEKTSFTAEDRKEASEWLTEGQILVAEYWEVQSTYKTIYMLEDGTVVDELPEGQTARKTRKVEVKKILQTITNGVEILEENPQPGKYIPIVPVIGKEVYLDSGSGTKRHLLSMIRLARDPQMSLAYLNSGEMEEAGLTPKVPYVGYVGQFETDKDTWDSITKVPHAYAQIDPIVDSANGQVLPIPNRAQITPNFQAYEVAKDSSRRAIQSAMGIMPLPTAAQRSNEKSGAALDKINSQQAMGSFHFTDNFDRALMLAGRIIEDYIPVVYGDEREMSLRKADDSHRVVKLNTAEPYSDEETQEQLHYKTDQGIHSVTISTGPSFESQRDAVENFLEGFIQNLKGLPLDPQQAQKLLAMAIQMRGLGPKGDEMAEVISPSKGQNIPPELQAAMGKAQQENQALHAACQVYEQKIQELEFEKAAKTQELAAKKDIEQMKLEVQLAGDEITTKAQSLNERLELVGDLLKQFHVNAHEAGMQAADHAHEKEMAASSQVHDQNMADQNAANQSAQSAQDAAQSAEQDQSSQ
jgi:hypothetical protein